MLGQQAALIAQLVPTRESRISDHVVEGASTSWPLATTCLEPPQPASLPAACLCLCSASIEHALPLMAHQALAALMVGHARC